MEKQKTISKEVSYSGIGLHTGNNVSIKLKPAPENTGIVFVRTDLPGQPQIKADISNVLTTVRGTTVGLDEKTSIHTIEHLLAALFVFGVDNLVIEMNSNEPPVADGSALPFVELIKKAGITELTSEKKILNISKPVVYKNGDVLITAVPSDKFSISCTVVYNHPLLKTQFFSIDITPEIFEKEIAPARTYCFDYEIEALKSKGLAKGGNLENAIVIGAKKIHTKLRFEDEFVRHKILDLIGDISLLANSLKMEISALKCGHKNNIEFAKKIASEITGKSSLSEKSSWQIPEGKMVDIDEVKSIIPHRFPFLFVDKVILVEELKRAVGIKNVSAGEPFFQGHFPERPIMPGVLIVEALAQTSCVLLLARPDLKNKKLAYFMSINNVKFRKPVLPGDTVYLDIEVVRAKQTTGIVRGCAYVEGKPVTEAEFTFILVDKP
ncbi:MAG: UDP-3-O-acyl-N-acetylglucosamine deacetylase [Elusimicrobia bacterium]|nr:UDP-3-O-acyl-N-acetylglucosamine deacetylase [Elusimicrobiota bacterium]